MPKITKAVATELARKRVDELASYARDEFELLMDSAVELKQGWIFFFNSSEYVRTQNFSSILAGNGPIFVSLTGELYELSSATPWEQQLARFASRK
jgi:hypothetical protein